MSDQLSDAGHAALPCVYRSYVLQSTAGHISYNNKLVKRKTEFLHETTGFPRGLIFIDLCLRWNEASASNCSCGIKGCDSRSFTGMQLLVTEINNL